MKVKPKKVVKVQRPTVVPNLVFLSVCMCGNIMFSGPSACLECRQPRYAKK